MGGLLGTSTTSDALVTALKTDRKLHLGRRRRGLLVADGKIHYFIGGSMTQGETGSDAAARISEWVAANFQAETIGGTTVYALS